MWFPIFVLFGHNGHNRLIYIYSNGKQSLSLNSLLLTQFPLCCVVGFSLATCLLYLSYMLGLMGDYVATAQIAGYFLLCIGDFFFSCIC